MRKLIILGAGVFQVPAILKAREMGLYTIVFGKRTHEPGMSMADESIVCDTTDQQKVLEIAQRERVDGIMTIASELSAPTVAYVAKHMGLPGIEPIVTQTISEKDRLRQFLRKENLDDTQFGITYSLHEAEELFGSLQPPVIMKPVLASGSRGIRLINSLAALRENWEVSARESFRKKAVLLEEYLLGNLLGGQLLVRDNCIEFICISDKKVNGFFVPYCHVFPAQLSLQEDKAVGTLLSGIVALLPYSQGAMDFDLVLTERGPRVLEVGGRLGGNGLAELAIYHSGLDIIKETIRISLGDEPDTAMSRPRTHCALYILGSSRSGELKRYHRFKDVFPSFKTDLLQERHFSKPGMPVQPLTQSNHQLGHIMVQQPDRPSLDHLLERVAQVEWVEVT